MCQPCDDTEIDVNNFKTGNKVRYHLHGHNELAIIEFMKMEDDNLCTEYTLQLDNDRKIKSTHEFISEIDEEDPISLPREEYDHLKKLKV